MGGKFPTAQAGTVKTLSGSGTAVENVQMLALVVARPGLVRKFKMSLDHIGHPTQHQSGPLLAHVFNGDMQRTGFFHGL